MLSWRATLVSFFLGGLQKGYNFCHFSRGVGCSRIFLKPFGNGIKQKKVRESFSRLSHFVEVPGVLTKQLRVNQLRFIRTYIVPTFQCYVAKNLLFLNPQIPLITIILPQRLSLLHRAYHTTFFLLEQKTIVVLACRLRGSTLSPLFLSDRLYPSR